MKSHYDSRVSLHIMSTKIGNFGILSFSPKNRKAKNFQVLQKMPRLCLNYGLNKYEVFSALSTLTPEIDDL